MVVWSAEGQFLLWNPAATRLMGMGATTCLRASGPGTMGFYGMDQQTLLNRASCPSSARCGTSR